MDNMESVGEIRMEDSSVLVISGGKVIFLYNVGGCFLVASLRNNENAKL